MTNDEAVERVKAVAEPRLLPVSHVISRMYETDGNAFRDDLSHLLSRYERMEKALETISIGLVLLATDPVEWAEYTADLARQALGASE